MTRILEWTAADGTTIAARLHGPETSPHRPVVCLPGLTRNGRDFEAIAEALASGDRPRRVLAVDFRGRGRSGRADPSTYRIDVEAADVLAGLDRVGWAEPAFLGTSRGGLVTMLLAATAPGRVGPAVLNDIGPVIPTASLIDIRARMAAARGEPPAGWDEAAERLRSSLGEAFPGLEDEGWHRFARQTHAEDEAGRPVLDYDHRLADAFAAFDPEVGYPPMWDLFTALAPRPVMAIRGELSDLLSEEILAGMRERMPDLEIHRVPGEGHAPLLWDEPTIAAVRRFLDEADAAA